MSLTIFLPKTVEVIESDNINIDIDNDGDFAVLTKLIDALWNFYENIDDWPTTYALSIAGAASAFDGKEMSDNAAAFIVEEMAGMANWMLGSKQLSAETRVQLRAIQNARYDLFREPMAAQLDVFLIDLAHAFAGTVAEMSNNEMRADDALRLIRAGFNLKATEN